MARSTRDIVAGGSAPMRESSLRLSSVLICSKRMTESFASPKACGSSICVGRRARHCRRNDGGGVLVSRVVLHDEHGAYAALFAPHDGGEIGIIEFSAFDDHTFLLGARCSVIMICNDSIFRAPQSND